MYCSHHPKRLCLLVFLGGVGGGGGSLLRPNRAVLYPYRTPLWRPFWGAATARQAGCTVDKLVVKATGNRRPMPQLGIPQSVFATLKLVYEVYVAGGRWWLGRGGVVVVVCGRGRRWRWVVDGP